MKLSLPRLIDALKPAGILAFQMPALYDQPAAQAVNELANTPSWQPYRLHERYTLRVHRPGDYYDWLAPFSRLTADLGNFLLSRTGEPSRN